MAYGISYLKAMFGGFGQGLWNNETLYLLGNYAVLFVLAILGSTMLPKKAAGVVPGGQKADLGGKCDLHCILCGDLLCVSRLSGRCNVQSVLYFRFLMFIEL